MRIISTLSPHHQCPLLRPRTPAQRAPSLAMRHAVCGMLSAACRSLWAAHLRSMPTVASRTSCCRFSGTYTDIFFTAIGICVGVCRASQTVPPAPAQVNPNLMDLAASSAAACAPVTWDVAVRACVRDPSHVVRVRSTVTSSGPAVAVAPHVVWRLLAICIRVPGVSTLRYQSTFGTRSTLRHQIESSTSQQLAELAPRPSRRMKKSCARSRS